MRLWLPITVVAFIACCIFIYYYFSDPYGSRFLQFKVNDALSASSIPEELTDATYLLAMQNGGGLYAGGKLTFTDYAADGSVVVDLAREGEHEAKLRFIPLSQTRELSVDGSPVAEFDTLTNGVFLSPGASHVGIAVQKDRTPSFYDPSNWELSIIAVDTKEARVVEGFAGVFLDEENILVFRTNGVVVLNLQSGEETVVDTTEVLAVHIGVTIDRATSKIAYGTISGTIKVFDLIKEPSLMLISVGEFAGEPGIMSVFLTSQNVYAVRDLPGGGTRITRYGIFEGDSQVVRTLPKVLEVERLLP